MPEGNEIHRWAARHTEAFVGRKLRVEAPGGRFADADVIDGKVLKRVHAVGKHLGYEFGPDAILHVHLGRYGDWTEGVGELPEVKGALRVRLSLPTHPRGKAARMDGAPSDDATTKHGWYSEDDGSTSLDPKDVDWIELRGPSDCSLYDREKWQKLLARLGPDPLNGDDPAPAFAKTAKSKTPIAALLMDQSILSGIGNIYRAELLYRARLSPFLAGKDVPEKTLKAIWKDSIPLLKAGMVDRRIVTTLPKDRPHKTGKPLKPEVHYVYRRHGKPCWVCGTKVQRQEMAGRSLYWCPECQKE
ncbi:Fpg/Nei family DNA glycosylase [Terriglobus tenax]|uniref:Fpg/Nei family DNA glycosylase n=1 Tax=Terriglobus tenax TaxID=1111115 RepID=UPI0021E0D7D8|nr:zinc finger domain-containing protein [Terriglobus tenax]